MAVEITNRTKSKIDKGLLKKIAETFLKKFHKEKLDLSIVFVGDKRIRTINKIYRGYDKPTDILSFEGEGDSFGELIIDYAQIKRQAGRYNNNVKEELIFILVHGLFHLLGYGDETEKDELRMIKLGESFIKNLRV